MIAARGEASHVAGSSGAPAVMISADSVTASLVFVVPFAGAPAPLAGARGSGGVAPRTSLLAWAGGEAVTRPAGLIDPWARRINLEDLARLLHERHRGYDRRVKVRDLGAAVLGMVPKHGSAQDVALRETVSKLVDAGLPIGTEPGPDGGIWWIATEHERLGVLVPLMGLVRSLQRRIDAVQHASLDFRLPTGAVQQERLL